MRQRPSQRPRQHQPGFDHQRPGAADTSQCRQPELAVHQRPVERNLERQASQLYHHHRARFRDRRGPRVENAEQQHGGHRPDQRDQIGAHVCRHGLAHARQGDEGAGFEQQQRAWQRHQRGEPCALSHVVRDFRAATCPEVLGDGRRERQQHAHRAHEDREIDRGAKPHHRQRARRVVPGHHGVDDTVGHGRELRDQHRPRRVARGRGRWPKVIAAAGRPRARSSCGSVRAPPGRHRPEAVPLEGGRKVFAIALPSSTPIWSKLLMFQITPCTNTLCS